MRTSKNERNVVVVSHKVVHQPDDDLVLYLNNKKYANILHIMHSFANAPDRKSKYVWYQHGKVIKEKETKDYRNLAEPFLYIKELYFTILWVVKSGITWDSYIGFDGLCVLFGNVLRFSHNVRKTIFWAIDFVPTDRFAFGIKNKIYQWINTNSCKNVDEMWDLSPRMAEGRKQFFGIKKSDYKKYRLVPYGLWLTRIKPVAYKDCEKQTLIFMGNLSRYQGLQLIVSALPKLLKKYPRIKLKVIGEGDYTEEVKKLSRELKVDKYCIFLGRIKDNILLEKEVAKCAISLATYLHEFDNIARYADPGKVKTYLACGVPVLTTDIPWNAKDIEKYKCGIITTESEKDIIKKIEFLLDAKRNEIYRRNAMEYAKSFDFEMIFSKLDI